MYFWRRSGFDEMALGSHPSYHPSLPPWLAFTCVSSVPKKKLNRRRGEGEMERAGWRGREGEREAGSTHIARCLSGLLSDSAAVALEKASRACSRTAVRRAAQRREHARSTEL